MAPKFIKISRVSPATKLAEPLILQLNFFDLLWLKLSPIKQVTFYKLNESSSHDTFYSEIIPKLERSLSLALNHFLPLSGHIKWNPQDTKPHIIVLPEDYVSLTVAETDADFSYASSKGLRLEKDLLDLVPELDVLSDSASVLAIQITLFPNQGFSIGTAAHHVAMDGKIAAKFLNSWAHLCKSGTIPQDFVLPTILDRTTINVPAQLESKIFELLYDKDKTRTLKVSPPKEIDDVMKITLDLSQENVEKLRKRAEQESSRSDLHLSTFVITYAYVWTCLVKARGGDADRPVRFMYLADFRNRLDPPVPETYFGNCVLSIDMSGYRAKTFMGRDGFVNGVEILSDSVKGLGSLELESIWECYKEGTKHMKPGTQLLEVTGSNNIGTYGSDFGWGRPVNIEFMSLNPTGDLSMSERRDEAKGVEIGITMQKHEMNVFIPLFLNGLEN